MGGSRTLETPDFIEDPDFIPPDEEENGLQSREMPRMRNGQPSDPAVTRIPNPISSLQGENDNTGFTMARDPTFSDRVGQSIDQNLRQVPEALLRTLSGHATAADNRMGQGIKDNIVGPDSGSTLHKVLGAASYPQRTVLDTLKKLVTDPAGSTGDILSGVIGGEAFSGGGESGNGSGGRSTAPGVEAETRANSGSSGSAVRSGSGGNGSGTRATVPPGAVEGAPSLLQRVGGSKLTKFALGHRGSMALDAVLDAMGGNGKEPIAAPEAPMPHSMAGKGVFGSRTDLWGRMDPETFPRAPVQRPQPAWKSLPDVDVSQGGHSVQTTVADQASTAGQQGSADRVATEVQMSPAPEKLVRRSGLNPDPTTVKRASAIPSAEYDPNIGVGPKEQDQGAKVRAEKPPIPRGEKRARVRTPEEVENTKFWKQARQEMGGEGVEVGQMVNGKPQHSGVGSVSPASTDQIEARVNELKAASKLKKAPANVTKVPSSGVGSVGDINPHPRQYHPEQPMPDDAVSQALGLKKRRR